MRNKKFEAILFSSVGVGATLLLLIAFNFIASQMKYRSDLTEEKLYTLSDSTKSILKDLDSTVTIRFYTTRDSSVMPLFLKNYAQRVEDVLAEYKEFGKGRIKIEKLDPKPESDVEDKANFDGVSGQPLNTGESIYLGLAVICADETVALPFLSPDRENLLEYDLTRAVSRATNPKKPVVGIMSALPVMGSPGMQMMQRRGTDPWILISELRRDFELKSIDMTSEKIDDEVQVLLVIHPKDITDKTQFALDQFVMRGGKLIAFVDPYCLIDRSGEGPMAMFSTGQSSLDKLFKAWGVEWRTDEIITDRTFMTEISQGVQGSESSPTVLTLTEQGINGDDVATSQLDNLLLPFAGTFQGHATNRLERSVLLHTTGNSQPVDKFRAQASSQELFKDYKASGKEHALAIRLSGKFTTAFPEGQPKEASATNAPVKPFLKESVKETTVTLVGDVDMLFDNFSAYVQNMFGQKVAVPRNGNLSLAQNLVEQMSGDSRLIGLRSRATLNRPFVVVKEMQAEAEKQFQTKIQELEKELEQTQVRLNELQGKKEANQKLILSPEQEAELKKFQQKQAEVKKSLKEERKKLRREIDSLQTRLTWFNVGAMPGVVVLSGIIVAIYRKRRTRAI